MSSEKPVILLIIGGWHFVVHYQPFIDILKARGYHVVAPELPSNGDETPEDPPAADIDIISNEARRLAEEGKEVVAVAHSYGGVVATEALSGLGTRDRKSRGVPGGVKQIVFVAAFMLPEGTTIETVAPIETARGMLRYEGGYKELNRDMDVGVAFYPDLPREEQQKWLSLIGKHAEAGSLYSPGKFSYRDIPSAYVFCEKDGALPFFSQKALVTAIQRQGVDIQEESLSSGHFPFLSMPEQLADLILKYA